MNKKQILQESGLDFEIVKMPLKAHSPIGEVYPSTYWGLVNSKTGDVLNTVKKDYRPAQNIEVIEMIIEGSKQFGELSFHKGGAINGGRKIFFQLKISGISKVCNDLIDRYITICNSNDSMRKLSIGIGDTTISCMNQFGRFYKKSNLRYKHTSCLEDNIKLIPIAIEEALKVSLKQIKLYEKMWSTPLTKKLANDYLHQVVLGDSVPNTPEAYELLPTKTKNIIEHISNHVSDQTKEKGYNLWGFHSGVTSYTTHQRKTPRRENGFAESLYFGSNYKTNNKSISFAEKIMLKEKIVTFEEIIV